MAFENVDVINPVLAESVRVGGDIAEGDILAITSVGGEVHNMVNRCGIITIIEETLYFGECGWIIRVAHDTHGNALSIFFLFYIE